MQQFEMLLISVDGLVLHPEFASVIMKTGFRFLGCHPVFEERVITENRDDKLKIIGRTDVLTNS